MNLFQQMEEYLLLIQDLVLIRGKYSNILLHFQLVKRYLYQLYHLEYMENSKVRHHCSDKVRLVLY